jgi:hypothetical protein
MLISLKASKIEKEKQERTKVKRFQKSDIKNNFWDTKNFRIA